MQEVVKFILKYLTLIRRSPYVGIFKNVLLKRQLLP